jgi:hypothetical protein
MQRAFASYLNTAPLHTLLRFHVKREASNGVILDVTAQAKSMAKIFYSSDCDTTLKPEGRFRRPETNGNNKLAL